MYFAGKTQKTPTARATTTTTQARKRNKTQMNEEMALTKKTEKTSLYFCQSTESAPFRAAACFEDVRHHVLRGGCSSLLRRQKQMLFLIPHLVLP